MNSSPLQSVRDELRKLPHEKYWQVSEHVGEILRGLVLQLNAKNVLEIGTSSGYSSLWIIEALAKTDGHLYTIESHGGRFQFALENFHKAAIKHFVTQIQGHAPACINEIPVKNFDLAFFDATKRETISFFEIVWPMLNANGMIVVDNVISHAEKMQPFFEFLDKQKIPYQIMNIDEGIAIIKKNYSSITSSTGIV